MGGKKLKANYWKIVYATWESQYEKELQELKEIDEETTSTLVKQDRSVFCMAFISTFPKCESGDNNMTDCFNGWICRARTMPIIQMLEEIRTAFMERMKNKSNLMANSTDEICPRVRQKIEKMKWESRLCVSKAVLGDKF